VEAGRHLDGVGLGTRQRAGTHLRKASWLLRKGKKEGSQISPWSKQASVQALPGAASQARRELVGGQAPGTELAFWAHSRWVALGARMKGLCFGWVPGGAGLGAAQKSCQEERGVREGEPGLNAPVRATIGHFTECQATSCIISFIPCRGPWSGL
jgi:hypothetical protein